MKIALMLSIILAIILIAGCAEKETASAAQKKPSVDFKEGKFTLPELNPDTKPYYFLEDFDLKGHIDFKSDFEIAGFLGLIPRVCPEFGRCEISKALFSPDGNKQIKVLGNISDDHLDKVVVVKGNFAKTDRGTLGFNAKSIKPLSQKFFLFQNNYNPYAAKALDEHGCRCLKRYCSYPVIGSDVVLIFDKGKPFFKVKTYIGEYNFEGGIHIEPYYGFIEYVLDPDEKDEKGKNKQISVYANITDNFARCRLHGIYEIKENIKDFEGKTVLVQGVLTEQIVTPDIPPNAPVRYEYYLDREFIQESPQPIKEFLPYLNKSANFTVSTKNGLLQLSAPSS